MTELFLPLLGWAGLLAGAALMAFLVLIGLGTVAHGRMSRRPAGPGGRADAHFLFRQNALIDSSEATLPFDHDPDGGIGWQDLRDWLQFRFPCLPRDLSAVAADGTVCHAIAEGDDARVIIQPLPRGVRVTLADPAPATALGGHEHHCLRRRHAELTGTMARAPFPAWATDARGGVLWRNAAFTAMAEGADALAAIRPARQDDGTFAKTRVPVPDPAKPAPRWFEVDTSERDGQMLHFATDITKVVHAETAQREFVQTLTKTFATLTTGLVVFDRNRQLALFNPALIDHTGLSAEFLSGRPGLFSFFDQLRNRQVMPEPKSYATWRARINDVVASAAGGAYQETWSLPDGTTFRVSGRPHPDGAVAFLFEDISAEISLTRRFRAQLDLREAVLDRLGAAVVVIGAENIVLFCNRTCRELLGIDPDSAFADMSADDLVSICETKLPDPGFWPEARRRLAAHATGEAFEHRLERAGETPVACRLLPLAGGGRVLMLLRDPPAIPAQAQAPALA